MKANFNAEFQITDDNTQAYWTALLCELIRKRREEQPGIDMVRDTERGKREPEGFPFPQGFDII